MEYCSSEAKRSFAGHSVPSKIWKMLTLLGVGLAIFAVLASTTSLIVVLLKLEESKEPCSSHLQEAQARSLEPFRTSQENEQLVSEIVHKKHYYGHRNRRSMACLSDEQKNKTPTAHITGTDGYQKFTFEGNKVEILSDKWLCDNKYAKAHVAGGMTFVDGFLKVPYDGVYFVYSQVSLEAHNSTEAKENSKPIVMGHNTMICDCPDEEKLDSAKCKCYTEESQSLQLASLKNIPLLQSTSETYGALKGSHFHGGLFHLTANSYISIIPVVTKPDNPKTKVYARYTNSFYGAFLVSQ